MEDPTTDRPQPPLRCNVGGGWVRQPHGRHRPHATLIQSASSTPASSCIITIEITIPLLTTPRTLQLFTAATTATLNLPSNHKVQVKPQKKSSLLYLWPAPYAFPIEGNLKYDTPMLECKANIKKFNLNHIHSTGRLRDSLPSLPVWRLPPKNNSYKMLWNWSELLVHTSWKSRFHCRADISSNYNSTPFL